MKIVLLKDIENLGVAGDVVDVKPGYAHNYLLKDERAVLGTKENLERVEEIREEQAKRNAENKEAGEKLAEILEDTSIVIPAKAGTGDKLFGSVTKRDIMEALVDQAEITIDDKKKILLDQPIRALGEHAVRIRTFPEIEATLTVKVVQE